MLASLPHALRVLEGETNIAIIIENNRSSLTRSHTSSQTTSSSLSTTECSSKTSQHASLFREVSQGEGRWSLLEVIAHRNVSFTHATATIDIVLTHDAIAVLKTLTALESAKIAHGGSDKVGRVVWIQNIDTAVGKILSVSIWGEDLDSAVNTRDRDGGFIRVTCAKTLVMVFQTSYQDK